MRLDYLRKQTARCALYCMVVLAYQLCVVYQMMLRTGKTGPSGARKPRRRLGSR